MFQTGLGARDSALGGLIASGGYTRDASNGTATWASPTGPRTATQAGFGTVAGGGGAAARVTTGVLSLGTISLGLLIFIWWSLPR